MGHEVQHHRKHDSYEEEDEIDLYELIAILLKNKVIIIVTALIVSILAVGASVYVKSKVHNRYGIETSINYDLVKSLSREMPAKIDSNKLLSDGNINFVTTTPINFEKVDIEKLLKDDEVVKKIFTNENLKSFFLKSGANLENIVDMRNFLEKSIKISSNPKEKDLEKQNIVIELDFLEDKSLSSEIGDIFINLYNEKVLNSINKTIDEKYNLIKVEREKALKKLESSELKMRTVVDTEFKNKYANINIEEVISIRYPRLYSDLKNDLDNYNRYNIEISDLEMFKNEKKSVEVLTKNSSYYIIPGTSKAKMILAIGVFLGIALGLVLAFLKEFIEGYKKR